jgi:light-regulated signal transduction histidine kinase (bacteriophytochrome)
MDTFSYSVSHDVKAPLRAVNGYMNIFLQDHSDELSPPALGLAKKVVANAERLTGLIDGLLAYFRFGKKTVENRSLVMTALVQEVAAEVFADDDVADFSLKSLANTTGDPFLVKQLWLQLLSNAKKFSARSEQPQIEAGSIDQGGETVYYVKDNGCGFNMEYAEKLFTLFQRLHTQREFEGNGIGLALCARIVKKHGGRIWCETSEGNGATFFFTLK